jgi:hypothetical protein
VPQGNQIIDYMVIFTTAEYAFLRYDPSNASGKYIVASYTAFGVQMPVTGVNASSQVETGRDEMMAFLKKAKPSLFTNSSILIKYEVEPDPSMNAYEVDILTQYGSYFTRVYQKGMLYLSKIIQISLDTCAELD